MNFNLPNSANLSIKSRKKFQIIDLFPPSTAIYRIFFHKMCPYLKSWTKSLTNEKNKAQMFRKVTHDLFKES